jgi:hypothetical protein
MCHFGIAIQAHNEAKSIIMAEEDEKERDMKWVQKEKQEEIVVQKAWC